MVRNSLNVGLLLLAISILFNFTGCKNQNQVNGSSTINDLKPVTLTFYLPGPAKQQTQEVFDKVSETSNLNVKLNFKWIDNNKYSEQIMEAISAGESFDAFLCGRPEPGSLNFLEMFRNNQIKDITELLPRYAPSIFGQLSKYEIESAKVDNKIVAIPSLFPEVNCVIAAARQDLLDKYKISSITTLKEYGDFLKLIKENEDNIVPGRLFYSIDLFVGYYGYNVLDYQQSLVYKKDDPSMKITPWEQTPEFKETAELISTWFKSGYIKPNNGQKIELGSLIINSISPFEGKTEMDINSDGNRKTYNCFILNIGKKIQRSSVIGSIKTKGAIVFNSKSKNIERALMFLNWVQSNQENYDLFIYGIKDKHYILKGERIGPIQGQQSLGTFLDSVNGAFQNIKYARLSVSSPLPDIYLESHINFINSKTTYAPHEGFYPDYREVQPYSEAREQLYKKIIDNALIMGTFDVKQTDRIINDLKAAGTDKLVQSIQKQLDIWMKNNH